MVALTITEIQGKMDKSTFRSYINENLDACANFHEDIISKIRFRDRIETSLKDLLESCVDFTLEAFREGENMEDIRYGLKG